MHCICGLRCRWTTFYATVIKWSHTQIVTCITCTIGIELSRMLTSRTWWASKAFLTICTIRSLHCDKRASKAILTICTIRSLHRDKRASKVIPPSVRYGLYTVTSELVKLFHHLYDTVCTPWQAKYFLCSKYFSVSLNRTQDSHRT